MFKKTLVIALLIVCHDLYGAGHGRSVAAVPSRIDNIGSQGFLIRGQFGNPGTCTTSDSIFISNGHAQFDRLYSTVLAAFMAAKKIQIYVHSCVEIPWLSGSSADYNQLTGGDLIITN